MQADPDDTQMPSMSETHQDHRLAFDTVKPDVEIARQSMGHVAIEVHGFDVRAQPFPEAIAKRRFTDAVLGHACGRQFKGLRHSHDPWDVVRSRAAPVLPGCRRGEGADRVRLRRYRSPTPFGP